jgi:hypothetical protein
MAAALRRDIDARQRHRPERVEESVQKIPKRSSESPTNPTLEAIEDVAVADIAHTAGARPVVDNVFATPLIKARLYPALTVSSIGNQTHRRPGSCRWSYPKSESDPGPLPSDPAADRSIVVAVQCVDLT